MKSALCNLLILGCASPQFNKTAQDEILKIHNDLRTAIAKGNFSVNGVLLPAAANMRKMKWDLSLAESAQNYSNNCPIGPSANLEFGENMAYDYTESSSTLDEMAFRGYKGTSIRLDEANLNSGGARATQMAWVETEFVGCGIKDCGSRPFLQNMYKFAVVCRYKEKGNILNSNIYQSGDTCSSCPSGFKCEGDSGLCVSEPQMSR